MRDAHALKAGCERLAREAPAEFWKAKETFARMLPLLDNEKTILRNRGGLILLAREAEEGIRDGKGAAIGVLVGEGGRWASGIAFFGGAAAVVWGMVFGEIGGWCGNILKAGGALSMVSGIGIQIRQAYRLGQSIEFPVNAKLFLEGLSRHIGFPGNKD